MSEWEICDLVLVNVHIAPIHFLVRVQRTLYGTRYSNRWMISHVVRNQFVKWTNEFMHLPAGSEGKWNCVPQCIHSTNSIKTTLERNFPAPAKPSPQLNAIYLRESTIRIQIDNRIDFSANNIFRSLPFSLYPFQFRSLSYFTIDSSSPHHTTVSIGVISF